MKKNSFIGRFHSSDWLWYKRFRYCLGRIIACGSQKTIAVLFPISFYAGFLTGPGELTGADIIHWNSGEWDICNLFGDGPFTDENEYVSQCLRVADLLLARAKK